jgi:chromosome partitioning protein
MRTSVAGAPPHVVVIGNQKGGSGKSTFAMHIIVALLKAGKRVASFDLDLNQLTLTRYLGNRRKVLRPTVIEVLDNPLAAAELGDTVLAAEPF